MKRYYAFFVNRPLLVHVLMALIIIGGLMTVQSMPVDTMPKFDLGIVNITTVRQGASPEDMELAVTVPIEEEVLNVNGVYKLQSRSMEGMSVIVARLMPDATDTKKIIQDIQKAVDRAAGKLPGDITAKPEVEELSSAQVPVMELHISGNVPEKTLRKTAKKMQRELRELNGVAAVDLTGYRKREVKIYISPERLYHRHISYDEIIAAVQRRNVRDSGGTLESFGAEKKVLTVGQFDTPKEVENVIIRSNGAGNYVRIKDVATVIEDFTDWSVENRCDGKFGIALLPKKKAEVDGLKLAAAVQQYVKRIRSTLPPGVSVVTVNDVSRFTKDMLATLSSNAIIGFVLVLVVLLAFFQFRLAFWVAMGLPVAMLIAAVLMPAFGLNIDMLTLYAVILMLGMLVDDAIVTGESIFAARESGLSWKKAAVDGAAAISMPVIVSTVTTVLAFLPLAFLGGLEGKFLFAFPVMVALILLGSLLECQTFLPAHLSSGKNVVPKPKKWFVQIQNGYDRFIHRAVHRRYVTIGIFVAACAGIILASSQVVHFNLYPEMDIDTFWVSVELPEGASRDETREKVAALETHIRKSIPQTDMLNITAQLGHHDTDIYGGTEGRNPAWALLTVFMKPQGERKSNSNDIIARLRKDAKDMRGFKSIVIRPMEDTPVAGQPVEVEVISNTDERYDLADELQQWLQSNENVVDAWTSYKPGKEIVKLSLNHEALANKGLTVADITRVVRVAFDGVIINQLQTVEESIDFRLQFQQSDQGKLQTLNELMIQGKEGQFIPLRSLAAFEEHPGEAAIKHYLGDRTVTVYASIDKGKTSTAQINNALKKHIDDAGLLQRYKDSRLFFGGELEQQQEAMGNMGIAFLFSIMGLFFLFVLLFNSFTQPFLIMSVIPFGFVGVLIGFGIQGMELSMIAMFGIIGLAGVLVNDSTVMVHGLNRKKEELNVTALSSQQVADGAATRLRPIMITSITTVVGLAPAAYEIGGANPFMTPMIMAMLWGVLFGTVVSLILLPCLFASEQDVRSLLRRIFKRKKNVKKSEFAEVTPAG
ncbi:MAG: efflux RND transporter permease subunit [Deltaproteobacteria bacterium]|nr:efflux RND transporter permease subunit [Deltaproteobacteria bacterium]